MNHLETHVQQAKSICKQQGVRLTAIREKVLRLLLEIGRPVSAYDLLEQYKMSEKSGSQPMTIYRALSFLESFSFIHKLESTRQYVACHHLDKSCHSEFTQFLMCNHCGDVEEVPLTDALWKNIQKNAKKTHFKVEQPSLEIHGICNTCQTNTEDQQP